MNEEIKGPFQKSEIISKINKSKLKIKDETKSGCPHLSHTFFVLA